MSKTFTDEEVTQVRRTLALYRSMAACGEQPSAASEKEIQGAFDILDKPQPSVEPVEVERCLFCNANRTISQVVRDHGGPSVSNEWLDSHCLNCRGLGYLKIVQPSISARAALMELQVWAENYKRYSDSDDGWFVGSDSLQTKIDQLIKERGL